jgi:hypothetical protein
VLIPFPFSRIHVICKYAPHKGQCLQKLCKHLGGNGENINTDIRQLAADNIIPPLVVKVADTVRIAGNNAVHENILDASK